MFVVLSDSCFAIVNLSTNQMASVKGGNLALAASITKFGVATNQMP
jgi:hypothetical protein